MAKQPLLILCCCFISGIILREHLFTGQKLSLFLLCLSAFTLLSWFSRNIGIIKLRKYFTAIFCVLLGIVLHGYNLSQPALPHIAPQGTYLFKLTEKLNSNEKNRRFEVIIYTDQSSFGSVLSVPRSLPELSYGHYYQARLYINRVEEPEHNYQFNYARYLSRKDIYYQSYLPQDYRVAKRKDLSFAETIKQKRLDVLQQIDSTRMSPRSREFLKGIILADRTEMDRQTVSDFTKTGLVHILAISGSHIVIIFGLVYLLLMNISPPGYRRTAITASLLFIWAFAIFIDYGNSVVRSCIMISVYYIYVLLQRKTDLLHSIALAAWIILFTDTHQLFDVGFQLSFVAVFGIFWLNQPILKYLPRQDTFMKRILANTFSITMAAQIATLPLVLYYFHQFSAISVVANLIVVPLSNILIIFSLGMTVLIGLTIVPDFILYFYDRFILLVLDLIHLLSELDGAMMYNVPVSLPEIVLMCAGIYFLRFLIKKPVLKNFVRIGLIAIVFTAVHETLDFLYRRKSEALVHTFFREQYFSVKEKDRITFWIHENSDRDRVQKYIIDPYLTSRRATSYEVKILPMNAASIEYGGKIYRLKTGN